MNFVDGIRSSTFHKLQGILYWRIAVLQSEKQNKTKKTQQCHRNVHAQNKRIRQDSYHSTYTNEHGIAHQWNKIGTRTEEGMQGWLVTLENKRT